MIDNDKHALWCSLRDKWINGEKFDAYKLVIDLSWFGVLGFIVHVLSLESPAINAMLRDILDHVVKCGADE